MSESTLSLSYPHFANATSRFLGYGADYTALSAADLAIVDECVQTGLRQFYFPPPIGGNVHEWSFMKPTATLLTWADNALLSSGSITGADYDSPTTTITVSGAAPFTSAMAGTASILITDEGTFAIASYTSSTVVDVTGDASAASSDTYSLELVTGVYDSSETVNATTLTAAGGTPFYPSMVGKSIVVTDIGTFIITGYTSTTVITVSGDATATTKPFSVAGDGDFRLPDDFGGIEGPLTFTQAEGYPEIPIRSSQEIRSLRQRSVASGRPYLAAIQVGSADGTDGQRFDLKLYPTPDGEYNLTYEYNALKNRLTPAAPFPLGGMAYGDVIKESCLAEAELKEEDGPGVHAQAFAIKLATAISFDKQAMSPDHLPYNHDKSTTPRRIRRSENVLVTVGGVNY